MNLFVYLLEKLPLILFYTFVVYVVFIYSKDKLQNQHSILKTHPVIGRMRYILEMIGPEFRQYWFLNDKEAKPIDRDTQELIAKAGKYNNTVIGFGSKKDFKQEDYYLTNAMFPVNMDELNADNKDQVRTFIYKIENEKLISRKEKREKKMMDPWLLDEPNEVVIGEERQIPFRTRGLIGISAMSYGALSKNAVQALSQGVAISGGSWINTGEGSISPYHLSKVYEINTEEEPEKLSQLRIYREIKKNQHLSNFEIAEKFGEGMIRYVEEMVEEGMLKKRTADLIFQIGSGLYGARKNGRYDEKTFLRNALKEEVKAIEIKLAQGAKVRGGKLPKEKITQEIADIRGIEMGEDIESPNRSPLFNSLDELFDLIVHWQDITGKPVGIKVVAGDENSFEELARKMKKTKTGPDFIAIDGGEGGTGATYQEMADTLGLPIQAGVRILHNTLKKHGIRDRVKIIASGMLAAPNKMSVILSLGADLIYVARAAMNTVGCINTGKCHTNFCPVGVTSHLKHLESGLSVSEKRYRTANYLATMRKSLFMLAASCGLSSPTGFSERNITYYQKNGATQKKSDKLRDRV